MDPLKAVDCELSREEGIFRLSNVLGKNVADKHVRFVDLKAQTGRREGSYGLGSSRLQVRQESVQLLRKDIDFATTTFLRRPSLSVIPPHCNQSSVVTTVLLVSHRKRLVF
jgi:hypothetical protein